jgi:LAO/AO transport system kinase
VVRTVATRDTDSGVDDVLTAVGEHRTWLDTSGEGRRRRVARAAREVEALALTALRDRLGDVGGPAALTALAEQVVAGKTDPYRAADQLVAQL